MSRDGSVDLELDGQPYRFRLAIGDLERLQEATNLGAAEHLRRLYRGDSYSFRHLREIVRIALLGGAADFREVAGLTKSMDALPLVELTAVATLSLAAALEGVDDERLPRSAARDEKPAMPDGKMAFADFYGAAGAMKLTVADMRAMSLWQFQAYVQGHNRAQNPNAPDPLSLEEEDALWAWISDEAQAAPIQ